MSEAGFDILPRFTTWAYCKHKTRRYKHNFSTKGATQNSWTLEEKQTKSLKQKPKLEVRKKKEDSDFLGWQSEIKQVLGYSKEKIKGRQRLLRMTQQK